jgi:hypothetical protein
LFDLGRARIGTLFGDHSHSVLATLTFDYARYLVRSNAPPRNATVVPATKLPAGP